jgi:hypothetical protein
MPGWVLVGAPFFVYVLIVACLQRGMAARARTLAAAGAALGVLLAIAIASSSAFWVRGVFGPPAVLLIGYWASGLLWVGPMPRWERLLMRADDKLRVRRIAACMPAALVELLEVAYASVYPLIPVALVAYLAYAPRAEADRFWTVVLVTDFVCFAMLPWIQTRPPRALEQAPWQSRVRPFNLRMLGGASIGANTVPSGHAAEALACALLVSGAPTAVQAPLWTAALAVSAGAVFGRYHFTLDAIGGWVVALSVWMLFASG